MADKIDLKKTLRHLYDAKPNQPVIVDVPPMNFLMIDGSGDPNTAQAYQDAVEALYGVAYAAKFALKKAQGIDYGVPPLEGLWWVEDLATLNMDDKSNWLWTMLIMQPEFVTADTVARAVDEVRGKKHPPALDKLRLAPYHEGLSAQVMHVGPYSAELPTVARLHAFIADNDYTPTGKHHEIYLSDPRKSAPEKMRTILRQPVRKV